MAPSTGGPGPAPLRTYGNWRRPRSAGLGGLGLLATAVLFVLLAVCGVLLPLAPLAAVTVLLAGAVLLGPLAVRDRYGRHLGSHLHARAAYGLGRLKGEHVYRSGILSRVPGGRCLLPGLAMATDMYEARDGLGRSFGMLHYREADHFAAVLHCNAQGGSLVDQDDVDAWVANWGQFMRQMGAEPHLLGFQVVVEVAPDSGERLHGELQAQRSPHASELALRVMAAVDRDYPTAAPAATVHVALLWDGGALRGRRRPEEMAVHIGQRLPGITQQLAATGAGAAVPVTATGVAELVRTAYEPAVAPVIDRARAARSDSGLTWAQAGPVAHVAGARSYWHDGSRSVTWFMGEAPRGEVHSDVLHALLEAHPDIDRKRVALVYRPHSPAESAVLADRDYRAARSRTMTSRSGQAQAEAEYGAAAQSRREEARGAGLTLFGLVVTATVVTGEDAGQRPDAAEVAVGNLAAPARIALRRAWGCQDGGFLAGLPIGCILPEHQAFKLPRGL
ncbi:SCO6880 family protein [Streptomyces sp. NPDC001380]|uniref:SCO6880 family protein n=1 Tax=Streptomyces sp. NPDC001380 TaxID=3364566 RepID=UPI00369366A8